MSTSEETTVPHDVTTEDAIAQAEAHFDKSFDEVAALRRDVTEKLYHTVMKLDLDAMATRDAECFEAQMTAINTLSKLLSDTEKGATTRITTKLKKKETETSAAAVLNVSDILRSLNTTTYTEQSSPAPSAQDRDEAINKRFAELGLEPIIETELLTDNNTRELSDTIAEIIYKGGEATPATTDEEHA